MNRGAKVERLIAALKSATRAEREEGEAARAALERRRRAVRRQGRLVAALQTLGVTATRAAVHALRELGRDVDVESRKKYAKRLRKRAQRATKGRANRNGAPIHSSPAVVPSSAQAASTAAGESDMARIVKRVTEWIDTGTSGGGLPANDNLAGANEPCDLDDDECDLDGVEEQDEADLEPRTPALKPGKAVAPAPAPRGRAGRR